jgi:hypothetical protein
LEIGGKTLGQFRKWWSVIGGSPGLQAKGEILAIRQRFNAGDAADDSNDYTNS